MVHTVKGFSIVNETKVDVFLEFSFFLVILFHGVIFFHGLLQAISMTSLNLEVGRDA